MGVEIVTKTVYEYNGVTFSTMKEAKLEEAMSHFMKRLPLDGGCLTMQEYVCKHAGVIQDMIRQYGTEMDLINNEDW